MSLYKVGLKFYSKIISKKDPLFNISVKKQQNFLETLKLPENDFERSYNQYLCQNQGISIFKKILINIGAFPLYIYYLNFRKNDVIGTINSRSAIFISSIKNFPNIPSCLLNEFEDLKQEEMSGFYLTKADKKFIKQISSYHKFSFFFLFKCMIKIGIYRKNIEQYKPKAIITTSEYSFTSSILTLFCEENDIEHINIMHGEKLLYIRDSWFHFNRFYVWNQFYINLFTKNKAFCDKYYIEQPVSQKKWNFEKVNKQFDFTYYLQDQTKQELKIISNSLQNLKKQGYKVAIRPHPVYSNFKLLNILFKDFTIESNKLDIEHSILRTSAVISLFSTVNRQAYINGVDYIIDDLTNKKKYDQLNDLQYYFINKKHKVLSSYIK